MPPPPPLPLLIISSDHPTFDPDQLHHLTEYGYRLTYLHNAQLKDYQSLTDDIEDTDLFGIIAFGSPALHALHFATCPTSPALRCVVAYYPPAVPTKEVHPSVRRVLVHLPRRSHGRFEGSLGGGGGGGGRMDVRWYGSEETVGGSGGTGNGGDGNGVDGVAGGGEQEGSLTIGIGFAEMARGRLHGYSRICADLALSRDLETLRASGIPGVVTPSRNHPSATSTTPEAVWQDFIDYAFSHSALPSDPAHSDPDATLLTFGHPRIPSANQRRIPLRDFRAAVNGAGWKLLLVGCTVGVNRVADEVIASFKLTKGMAEVFGVERGAALFPAAAGWKVRVGREVEVGMGLVGEVRGGHVVGVRITWDEVELWRQAYGVNGEGEDGEVQLEEGGGDVKNEAVSSPPTLPPPQQVLSENATGNPARTILPPPPPGAMLRGGIVDGLGSLNLD